ncbi:hypothetical protein FUT88_13410 [Ralstonia sp. TCR112]|uniref:hypothetical protein n=1 Tax=Ralstonia sp. TCR112 TaxID=2601730 RepID=UPI0011BD57F0|nr:hypothetical protein [Ralstonia sp. TCR112]TXD58869.1 hypothetical protein FUT88_13410 [Ralstonia sp. TCR112]
MSVAQQILIGAQTGAATSQPFQLSAADGACSLVAGGLGASETATVQVQDAGGNWQNVPAAICAQMTSTTMEAVLNAPGIYRVAKTATAAAVGVVLYRI